MNPINEPSTVAHVVNATEVIPGLHIIANFKTSFTERLLDYAAFKSFAELLIEEFNLTSVGEVYHNFPNGGFTSAVCLTESHLSIHTWPDQNHLTFDFFASNFMNDNRVTMRAIYRAIQEFFQAEIAFEQIIAR